MLTLIFAILMIGVFGKMLGVGLRMGWGLMKMLVSIVFLPIVLVGMLIGGMAFIALPVLIIMAVVMIAKSFSRGL